MAELGGATPLHASRDTLEENDEATHKWGIWFHVRTGVTVSYNRFCYQNLANDDYHFERAIVCLFGKKKDDVDGLVRIIERAERRFKPKVEAEEAQDSSLYI